MAAVTRQPFAPLGAGRLQSLTSLKNRQNAVVPPAAGKRKVELLDSDDLENVDPLVSAKRSKGANTGALTKDVVKRPATLLLATPSTPPPHARAAPASPVRPASTSRRVLEPKSRAAKLDAAASRTSPMSAPAGRSPSRGRRSGLLSSNRPAVEPQDLVGSAAPLSLDAALRGTIAGYGSRPHAAAAAAPGRLPAPGELKAPSEWSFDIHEDTPEQEMTNLLQHGTCVLDISSDEESEQKARRDRAEGRDKENIPPAGHVSQKPARKAAWRGAHAMAVDKGERVALAEMDAAEFYPHGCQASSVILVPADEAELPVRAPGPAPVLELLDTAPLPQLDAAKPAR